MLKRAFDLLVACLLLTVTAPIMATIGVMVLAGMGRPMLLRQVRPGIHGRLFRILKFRTMKDTRGPDGILYPDTERLTTLGRWLRKWSLDELPELFNVVKGDMSLVGPRPLLPQYLERYTPYQARRHEVRTGLTGWAQVNGRNAITWEEKFALDVWYVDNQSFALDMKILAMTAWKVLRREGISAEGEATMPEFTGTVTTTRKSENA